MSSWNSKHAAFNTYLEAGRGRRRVLSGEGMLTPSRPFTWNGQHFEPDRARVVPDHPVAFSEYAHLLRPAYDKEAGMPVRRFLERVIRDKRASGTRHATPRARLPRAAKLRPPRLP